jgi:hypothetical protein
MDAAAEAEQSSSAAIISHASRLSHVAQLAELMARGGEREDALRSLLDVVDELRPELAALARSLPPE